MSLSTLPFTVEDWGCVPYALAADTQREYAEEIERGERNSTLVLVEHPPVFTLGANFHAENLLLRAEEYKARGFDVVPTDRGGDVTYHGPGQLVAYPIFDLRERKDLHVWLRDLEQAVIDTVAEFGVSARRFPPHTGVWVGDRKIAALGIKVRRWVSFHGVAINVQNDLNPFLQIVPCGIKDYGVTSLRAESDQNPTVAEVGEVFTRCLAAVWRDRSALAVA